MNHAETLRLLAKSIAKIGECLPRSEILSKLYPTDRMRKTIESLYSCILEFLLLAHGWCTESRFQHIYHSLTRPPELRYSDVLERISGCSINLTALAALGSQTEIRVMHGTQQDKLDSIFSHLESIDRRRQDQVTALGIAIERLDVGGKQREQKLDMIISLLKASGISFDELVAKTEGELAKLPQPDVYDLTNRNTAFHSIQTSAQLNTNQMLSDLQVSQILATFSHSFEDPDQSFRHHLRLCRHRARTLTTTIGTNKFWLSPKLTEWSSSKESSLTILKGNFPSRLVMQDFAVDIIQALGASDIPTAWALGNSNASSAPNHISTTVDIAKYLTYQVLRMGGEGSTEKQLALRSSQFHTARTMKEWLGLLEHVCKNLGRRIYLVLDLSTVRDPLEGAEGLEFILELDRVLRQWNQQSTAKSTTILKVVLLVYEEAWSRLLPDQVADSIVSVRTKGRKRQLGNRRDKKSGFLDNKSRLRRVQGR